MTTFRFSVSFTTNGNDVYFILSILTSGINDELDDDLTVSGYLPVLEVIRSKF